jgi:hypothetical protein
MLVHAAERCPGQELESMAKDGYSWLLYSWLDMSDRKYTVDSASRCADFERCTVSIAEQRRSAVSVVLYFDPRRIEVRNLRFW